MVKISRVVELIKKHFEEAISTKTGWGKNEVMKEFNIAVAKAALDVLAEED